MLLLDLERLLPGRLVPTSLGVAAGSHGERLRAEARNFVASDGLSTNPPRPTIRPVPSGPNPGLQSIF